MAGIINSYRFKKYWTPENIIDDVALWLDADDDDTFTLSDTEVLVWRDKSLNENDAISLGAFNPEFYPDFQNGKSVVFWNKMLGSMYMQGGPLGINGSDPRTYIIVNNTSSDGGTTSYNSRIFRHGTINNELNLFRGSGNTGQHRWSLGLGDSSVDTDTTGGSNLNQFRTWGLRADEAGWEFSRDGIFYNNGLEVVNTTDNVYQMGENSSSDTYRNAGYMCEIIIVSRILTEDEWWLMDKYLGEKWGVEINELNPYK